MTTSNSLAEVLKEAEKAVSAISDAEMRRVAFDRVLEHLLKKNPAKEHTEDKPPEKQQHKASEKTSKVKKKVRTGPTSWLQDLVAKGFFASPKSIREIREELDKKGHPVKSPDLTLPLKNLVDVDEVLDRTKQTKPGGNSKEVVWFNRKK